MIKKVILSISIIAIFIMSSKYSYAKYVIEYEKTIAKIEIDNIIPEIEVISIENKKLNSLSEVTINIKIIENNILQNNINKNQIQILLENRQIDEDLYEIHQIDSANGIIIYAIKINATNTKGMMKIIFPKAIIKDISGNENQEKIILYEII